MRIGVQALALALSKFVPESAVKSFVLETVGLEGAEVKGRWSPPRWWRSWLTLLCRCLCDALDSWISAVEIISHLDELQKAKKQQQLRP